MIQLFAKNISAIFAMFYLCNKEINQKVTSSSVTLSSDDAVRLGQLQALRLGLQRAASRLEARPLQQFVW